MENKLNINRLLDLSIVNELTSEGYTVNVSNNNLSIVIKDEDGEEIEHNLIAGFIDYNQDDEKLLKFIKKKIEYIKFQSLKYK